MTWFDPFESSRTHSIKAESDPISVKAECRIDADGKITVNLMPNREVSKIELDAIVAAFSCGLNNGVRLGREELTKIFMKFWDDTLGSLTQKTTKAKLQKTESEAVIKKETIFKRNPAGEIVSAVTIEIKGP